MMTWLRHRVYGHYWHADDVAKAYQRQPDGTMAESGFIVHMRCQRLDCDAVKIRRVKARPRLSISVSLRGQE